MDLQLSPEQSQLREAARRLLGQRLDALVAELPSPPVHDTAQALNDAFSLGWLGLGLPEKVGGAGSFEDLVLVHEELGRGLAPSLVTTLGLSARLLLHADPTSPLLEQLCEGKALVAPLRVPITSDGDRLDGVVQGVVDADAVTHLLVPAGWQLVCVPVDAAGVTLVDEQSACDIGTHTVVFEGVAVTPGPDAVDALDLVRVESVVLAAARALGGGRAVLERTVAHVSTRHQFGRAIGTFQAVQHQLADVATALDAAGLAVAQAAWAVEGGEQDATAASAIAGLSAQEAFQRATLVAHQLHGGMGFVLENPLHLWSARAIADPTVPFGRRQLLAMLASAHGIRADKVLAPPHHRLSGSGVR